MKALRTKKNVPPTEVPMSAMIDIVFLLLIYFVVTFMPMKVEAHAQVNLPSQAVSDTTPELRTTLFEIHVMPNDRYLLMGRRSVSWEQLEHRLTEIATLDRKQTVIIKVDGDAREASLVRLLDLCAKVKLENLNVLSLNRGS